MAEQQEHDLSLRSFAVLFGGWKGLVDGSVPSLVFLGVRLATDLNTAIIASVVSGLLIVGFRKLRGESLQQALSGFFILLVAVVAARASGSGKGFFLPGILITAFSGFGFLLSLLLKQPAVALVLVAVDTKYEVWQTHPPLRRACSRATAVWAATFFIRALVATAVALTVGDGVKDNAILFGVIQVERYALMLGAALYTLAVVRAVKMPASEA